MKKVAIIGPFRAVNPINGQTVKTKNLRDALLLSNETAVTEVDTYNWKKHPFKLFNATRKAVKNCDSIIMLPAYGGVKVFARLLLFFNRAQQKKLYYDVIGGWLPKILKGNGSLLRCLREFDGIWVETATMQKTLREMGMTNVMVVPNFKNITPVSAQVLAVSTQLPLRLAIFSRVSAEKGITDALKAIAEVNRESVKMTLDIYGPVEQGYRAEFEKMLSENLHTAVYKGVIDPKESVGVLHNYFALLFPTKSYTEGIPGTIIDAYCAGLPVIAAKWESYGDICLEGITSIGYTFGDFEGLVAALENAAKEPQMLVDMKKNCLVQAKKYISSEAASVLIEML